MKAGFEIVACVEIEEKYCMSLRANLGKREGYHSAANIHCEDIRDFNVQAYKSAGIECVIGGPPCQTFSAAGRRAGGVIGTEDGRGQLFQAYCRILRALKPKVFVFENVYGLPGANGGKPWREIVSAFSKIGYTLRAEVVDAADYGVPQHRERLIMVGFREGEFIFPLPTHGPDSKSSRPLVSVEKSIEDLQDPGEPFHNSLGGMYGHLLQYVPEGLNYAYFTAEMGHPEPVFAWRSKFHDLLYKVSRSEPCRTIKAQPGKFTGPFHWKNRHFTVAELKRLQTFPDNYQLVGSFGQVVEQIGNSVPPKLAEVIASSVRDQLVMPTSKPDYMLRPTEFKSTFRQRQRARTHQFSAAAAAAIAKQYRKSSKGGKTMPKSLMLESYFLSPRNLFDRKPHKDRSNAAYEVGLMERGRHIELLFDSRVSSDPKRFCIEITGLRKYLPNFDSLTAKGSISKLEDVFHLWGAIELALTKRSRFFSLIDIYGHYANRGDTVKVGGSYDLAEPAHVIRMMNWILKSENCGGFIKQDQFCVQVRAQQNLLPKAINNLRDARFDIRTSDSHAIIGPDRLICTYPFPLLSPRALVESRVVLSPMEGKKSILERAG